MSNSEENSYVMQNAKNDFSLRKSKSYNGPDSKYYQSNFEDTNPLFKYQTNEYCIKNLNCFPEDINNMAKHIIKGTIHRTQVYNYI